MSEPRRRSPFALRCLWTLQLARFGVRLHRWPTAVGCVAFALVTLALFAAAVAHSTWADGARTPVASNGVDLVAFLREDLPVASRDSLSTALGRLPGVARVRQLGSEQVLARLRTELGAQASVLDGVEEGFLPATLEITLQAGRAGADRADAIAWRLRRMEGITDVDILRTSADERVARLYVASREAGKWAAGLALVLAGLGLFLAAWALRSRHAEARLLTGLGFTTAGVAAPGALAGALSALAGAAVGGFLALVVSRSPLMLSAGVPLSDRAWAVGSVGALAILLFLGTAVGWWGARPRRQEIDDLGC